MTSLIALPSVMGTKTPFQTIKISKIKQLQKRKFAVGIKSRFLTVQLTKICKSMLK